MNLFAVLFDFDGTLFFGTTDINYYVINKALTEMGLPSINREIANSTVGDKLIDVSKKLLHTENEAAARDFMRRLICYTPEAIETIAVIEPDCIHMLETLNRHAHWQSVPMQKKSTSICCLKNLISSNIFNLFGTEKMDLIKRWQFWS